MKTTTFFCDIRGDMIFLTSRSNLAPQAINSSKIYKLSALVSADSEDGDPIKLEMVTPGRFYICKFLDMTESNR